MWAGSVLVKATEVGVRDLKAEETEGCQHSPALPCGGSLGPSQGAEPPWGLPTPESVTAPPPRPLAGCGEGAEAGRAAAAGVPDADRAVGRAGGQALGGRAEGQAPHRVPMALQDVAAQHAGLDRQSGERAQRQGLCPAPARTAQQPHSAESPSHAPSLCPQSCSRLRPWADCSVKVSRAFNAPKVETQR